MIAPHALVGDVHPLLALTARRDQRAVSIDDSLLEELLRLSLPNLESRFVHQAHQILDLLRLEPTTEVSGCCRIRNPLCA